MLVQILTEIQNLTKFIKTASENNKDKTLCLLLIRPGLAKTVGGPVHSSSVRPSPQQQHAAQLRASRIWVRHARPLPRAQAATWAWAGNSLPRLGRKQPEQRRPLDLNGRLRVVLARAKTLGRCCPETLAPISLFPFSLSTTAIDRVLAQRARSREREMAPSPAPSPARVLPSG